MKYKQIILQSLLISLSLVALVAFIASTVYFIYTLPKESTTINKLLIKTSNTSTLGTGHTVLNLIDKDFKDGRLDRETSLIYKVQYVFADDKLPQRYLSTSISFGAGELFYEITRDYDKLSTKTQQILEPYLKRPDDPESYLNKKYAKLLNSNKETSFKFIDEARAKDERQNSFKFLVTADKKIKVWHIDTNKNKKEAQEIVNGLNKSEAYNKFKKLLGADPLPDGQLGGDSKVDIYLVGALEKLDGVEPWGLAVPNKKKGVGGFALVKSGLNSKNLNSVVVHELFHLFQESFDQYHNQGYWWIESTAVWSEDYVYPYVNTEHGYVKYFIKDPHLNLTNTIADVNRPYGAYIFSFYLSKKYGDKIIKEIFEQGKTIGYIKGVEKVLKTHNSSLTKAFKEFALWNYNQYPIDYYKKNDKSGVFPGLPQGFNVYATDYYSLPKSSFIDDVKQVDAHTIGPLSSYYITFRDFAVKSLKTKRIDFTYRWNIVGADGRVSKTASVMAIIYPKTGEPYIEDWTLSTADRKFCLEKSKEDLKELVLIVSNASIVENLKQGNFFVKLKEECEEEKKNTDTFYIQQVDNASKTNVDKVLGNHVWNVTIKSDGKMTEPSQNNKYPYIGKWKVDYDYKEASQGLCKTLVEGAITSFEFDLTEAYNEALKTGRGSFISRPAKDCTSYTNPTTEVCCDGICMYPNGWCETVKSYNVYGELYDLTDSGAKILMKGSFIYDSETNAQRVRSEPTILLIKKKVN